MDAPLLRSLRRNEIPFGIGLDVCAAGRGTAEEEDHQGALKNLHGARNDALEFSRSFSESP